MEETKEHVVVEESIGIRLAVHAFDFILNADNKSVEAPPLIRKMVNIA